MTNAEANMVKDEELDMLITELYNIYGYDFTGYARASLKRRVNRLMTIDRFPSFAELFHRVKTDDTYLQHIVDELTVNVTEMFRDPHLFKIIREEIIPKLATYPLIRIWHAGCATGEEVYSMAILLEEAGILHKSLLYATDLNSSVLEKTGKGIFPMAQMKQYSENYILAGGKKDFSQYYTAKYEWAKFSESLRSRIIVSSHNLVSDRSFNEFQLILCRNVLIYFDKELQDNVFKLFDDSLQKNGFLVLGSRENLRFSPVVKKFQQFPNREKIWRKIG